MDIKYTLCRSNAMVPTYGSEFSAGADIYAALDKPITIPAGEMRLIPSGFKTEIPPGYFGAVFPRSGLSTKRGLRLSNCVAVIDSDYRGEWFIPLYNDSEIIQTIEPKEKVAQVVILPCPTINFVHVASLEETERGAGGFGSTGKF